MPPHGPEPDAFTWRDRQLWFIAPHIVELRDATWQAPTPSARGESQANVVVAALASTVSRGTEMLLYTGQVAPGFDALESDTPAYPRRYGYAWVGQVVDAGASSLVHGTRVFSLLPHGTHHCVHATQLRVLPAHIPAPRATLAANLETAITAVWDAKLGLGDDVLVLGAGVVGCLVAWLAAKSGANVVLCDPEPERSQLACQLGGFETVDQLPTSRRFDGVIEASGNPNALNLALLHAGRESQITVVSAYGTRRAAIDFGERFHRERQSLRSSQVSTLPALHASRWTYDRRFALVTTLLGHAELDLLVAHQVPFAAAKTAYSSLAASYAQLTTTFIY
jgi:2-desacetyl-2-hydroxyethyl bacteriochlorophyllide A dehydrogenase